MPARIEGITPSWLTSVLAESHPDVSVEAVETLAATQGTAHRLRLGLRYAQGRDGGLPSQMFAKTIVGDENQAWASMFRTEIDFYNRIRPELQIETPRIYALQREQDSDRFIVLMEDLALRDAQFLDCTKTVTVDDAAAVVSTLAALHAPYWGSPTLAEQFGYLETPNRGANFDNFVNLGPPLLEYELQTELKARNAAKLGRPLEQLWDAFRRLAECDAQSPSTLTHGDVHVGNTYLMPNGQGGLVDWQFARRCHGVHDVSYFLATALEPETRHGAERDLLGHYADELNSRGVEGLEFDDLYRRYRQNALWGVVMWLLTPSSMHRDEILETSYLRCLRAAEDLDTFTALGL